VDRLIDGAHREAAAVKAGLTHLPALIMRAEVPMWLQVGVGPASPQCRPRPYRYGRG